MSCPQTVVRPVLVLHPSSLVLVLSEPSLHLPYHRHPQVSYLLRAIPSSRPLLRHQFLHPSHVIRWWHPLLHPRHIWIPDSYFRPYRFLLQNCNTFFTVYTFSTSYVNILSRISQTIYHSSLFFRLWISSVVSFRYSPHASDSSRYNGPIRKRFKYSTCIPTASNIRLI